jgi:hypothetical protein
VGDGELDSVGSLLNGTSAKSKLNTCGK